MSVSGFSMFFIAHFKIIDISVEVSQKSTFQESWKNAYLQSPLRNTSTASKCPHKKPSKTLIIAHISLKSPPEGLTWANDVGMRLYQKWATSHFEKSFFRRRSQFWAARKRISALLILSFSFEKMVFLWFRVTHLWLEITPTRTLIIAQCVLLSRF